MRAEGSTYRIEGVMRRADGQACPPAAVGDRTGATPNGAVNSRGEPCYDHPEVRFRFESAAATSFGPCEVDGVPGFVMTADGTQTVALTIHGDHLFFNGFPEGAVTMDELGQLTPSDLAEIDTRFQLGGSSLELHDMRDYIAAQLRTQGHFQGEGECPFDGNTHDH